MSHASEVATSGDEMIRHMLTRDDGVEYYAIGRKITVTWRGKERYLCHTCVSADPCVHTRRIARFRNENAVRSGVISVDSHE